MSNNECDLSKIEVCPGCGGLSIPLSRLAGIYQHINELVKLNEKRIKLEDELTIVRTLNPYTDMRQLLQEAVTTDGEHHKQWYLEEMARLLDVDLPDHEEGKAP